MRVLRDLLRDERFFVKVAKKQLNPRYLMSEKFSQLGNVSFPVWECFVPNVGT
jgi:hypothetical protein